MSQRQLSLPTDILCCIMSMLTSKEIDRCNSDNSLHRKKQKTAFVATLFAFCSKDEEQCIQHMQKQRMHLYFETHKQFSRNNLYYFTPCQNCWGMRKWDWISDHNTWRVSFSNKTSSYLVGFILREFCNGRFLHTFHPNTSMYLMQNPWYNTNYNNMLCPVFCATLCKMR